MRISAASVVLPLVVAACSAAPPEPTPPVGTTASEIIGGIVSDDTQDAVVLLVYPMGMAVAECSGTLIAPNLVLTARHCVSKLASEGFMCDQKGVGDPGGNVLSDYDATNFYVVTGNKRPFDPTQKGKYAAKGLQLYHDDAKNLCNHDLALILLDTSIPDAKIAPLRLDGPAVVGETFTAVGWGVTKTTPEPPLRQQRGDVAVRVMGPGSDPSLSMEVPDSEFIVGEAICQGDSGGPSLSSDTGAILGVVSRGGNGKPANPNNPASGCIGGGNIYSLVSGHKDVILQAFADAGQDPWYEGGPDPRLAKFGAGCTGGDACRSGLCLTDSAGAGTTCTQACDAKTACPGGYTCGTVAGKSACVVEVITTTKCGCDLSGRSKSTPLAWGLAALALAWGARRRGRR